MNPIPGSQPTGPVERIVALQITSDGIVLDSTRPTIYGRMLPNGEARNWEAIARLEGRGLLLATDKYPRTILAFIEIENP